MNFASTEFAAFYLAIVVLYWATPRLRWRKVLLLLGSYYFYVSWNGYLVGLIAFSTGLDWVVGTVLHRARHERTRRWALGVAIAGNLGVLGIFKYANFFADSLQSFAGSLGLNLGTTELDLMLPVGISFYTFQTLSYSIDIYRKRLQPCESLLDFAVFVAFFPQLIAGPIVRASEFLPQLKRKVVWQWPRLRQGLWLIVSGLAKKIIIADTLAGIVNPVFANPQDYGFLATWLAVVGFASQIYCDFSGYSDVAIGTAKVIGFELPANFRFPYLAQDAREFWQRWHISLSTWLRDYLYIPLGGGRGGVLRTQRNLLITMLLGGLWHGAAWTFVAWGLYQGLLLALTRACDRFAVQLTGRGSQRLGWVVVRWGATLFLMCFGWVLFRAQNFDDALSITATMLSPCVEWGDAAQALPVLSGYLIVLVAAGHLLAAVTERTGHDWKRIPWARGVFVCACVVGIIAFAQQQPDPFIYYRF